MPLEASMRPRTGAGSHEVLADPEEGFRGQGRADVEVGDDSRPAAVVFVRCACPAAGNGKKGGRKSARGRQALVDASRRLDERRRPPMRAQCVFGAGDESAWEPMMTPACGEYSW